MYTNTPNPGWWLARNQAGTASGWVPSAYIEEIKPPPPPPMRPGGKPPPPAPPSKRPVSKQLAAASNGAADGRDSGYSTQTRDSGGSVAGGLAEALRARQKAMNERKTGEDDW